MRAVPIELPVNASEAGALADIVFSHAGGPKLDAARKRIAALVAARKFSSFTAHPGSLQRDPIHPTTFYMAVDDVLLRLAPASSPSSGLFPNSLLIGRLRTASGREAVVNAIPFAAGDWDNIRTFAEQVDPGFLPRTGLQPTGILVTPATAQNAWHTAVWQAIRSGLRGGWSATLAIASSAELPLALQSAGDFTRFSVERDASIIYAAIREARGRKSFDLELETTPEELLSSLSINIPVQFVAPRMTHEPASSFEARLTHIYEAARPFNTVLSLDPALQVHAALIGRVTGGRVNYRVHNEHLQP